MSDVLVKCSIVSLDEPDPKPVVACFNPKEITIQKQVPWHEHKGSKLDAPMLEFTDSGGASLAVELWFDTFEEGTSVFGTKIFPLEALAQVVPALERPPRVLFQWGNCFPHFAGVIETLEVKYTMFFSDGTPCRAIVTLHLKEAAAIAGKAGKSKRAASRAPARGTVTTSEHVRRPDKVAAGGDHRAVMDQAAGDDGQLRVNQRVRP